MWEWEVGGRGGAGAQVVLYIVADAFAKNAFGLLFWETSANHLRGSWAGDLITGFSLPQPASPPPPPGGGGAPAPAPVGGRGSIFDRDAPRGVRDVTADLRLHGKPGNGAAGNGAAGSSDGELPPAPDRSAAKAPVSARLTRPEEETRGPSLSRRPVLLQPGARVCMGAGGAASSGRSRGCMPVPAFLPLTNPLVSQRAAKGREHLRPERQR